MILTEPQDDCSLGRSSLRGELWGLVREAEGAGVRRYRAGGWVHKGVGFGRVGVPRSGARSDRTMEGASPPQRAETGHTGDPGFAPLFYGPMRTEPFAFRPRGSR